MPRPGNRVLVVAAAVGPQGKLWVLTFPVAARMGLHPSIDQRAPGCQALSGEVLPGSPPFLSRFPVGSPRERLGLNRAPGGFELSCRRLQGRWGSGPEGAEWSLGTLWWQRGGRTQWYLLRLLEAPPQPTSLPILMTPLGWLTFPRSPESRVQGPRASNGSDQRKIPAPRPT